MPKLKTLSCVRSKFLREDFFEKLFSTAIDLQVLDVKNLSITEKFIEYALIFKKLQTNKKPLKILLDHCYKEKNFVQNVSEIKFVYE